MNKWLKLFIIIGSCIVICGIGFVIYKAIDSSDGDVIVGTYDLAGSEKHGLPFSLSGDRTRLVLLSVCDRLYTEPVFPGTCGTVQNVECSKNHLSAAFISE